MFTRARLASNFFGASPSRVIVTERFRSGTQAARQSLTNTTSQGPSPSISTIRPTLSHPVFEYCFIFREYLDCFSVDLLDSLFCYFELLSDFCESLAFQPSLEHILFYRA